VNVIKAVTEDVVDLVLETVIEFVREKELTELADIKEEKVCDGVAIADKVLDGVNE
jgi:hypothetical protein